MKLHSTCIGPSSEKSVWNEVRPGTASYGVELSKAIVCPLSGAAAMAAARARAEIRGVCTVAIQISGEEGRGIRRAREQAGDVPPATAPKKASCSAGLRLSAEGVRLHSLWCC